MDQTHATAPATNGATATHELFALTDEQIIGLNNEIETPRVEETILPDPAGNAPNSANGTSTKLASTDAPQWLADRMRDPWHGDAAKELWDSKQNADKEIASYRESFSTPADARALKELYPGGFPEAKAASERARELDAIDAAFFRGDAAARTQLAQRMLQQDPAAFREMVEAGIKLLASTNNLSSRAIQPQTTAANDALSPQVQPEVVRAYANFESAANADLEKSVGGAIARVMDQALPNLRVSGASAKEGAHGTAPLRDRLSAAVREEVETALRSDRELGQQVSQILASRRFDDSSRAQVVRLIDTRAQQLVPGAVRRVVNSWTQATLGARAKNEATTETPANPQRIAAQEEKPAPRRELAPGRSRRIDYSRLSDEQILTL